MYVDTRTHLICEELQCTYVDWLIYTIRWEDIANMDALLDEWPVQMDQYDYMYGEYM
jgi:hypothetical protein